VHGAKTNAELGAISIRPTGLGWATLGTALVIGLAATKTHAPFMFLLSGGLLGAGVLSVFLSHWMVAPVRLNRNVPDRAWQDQCVHMGYYLENTRSRGTCLGLRIEEMQSDRIEAAGGFCLQLPPGRGFRAGGRFLAKSRGRLGLPGLWIETRYPFFLIRTRRKINQRTDVIIWPRRGTLKRDLLRHGAAQCSRAAPSQTKGGQDEFFGLREYRFGDDPRWIAWRRSASGKLVVREMSRPNPDVLLVVLDASVQWLEKETFERALRFAATLVDDAFRREYQVGLVLAEEDQVVYLPASGGLGQMRSCLDRLALCQGIGLAGLDALIGQIPRRHLRQAQVVMVSSGQRMRESKDLGSLSAACQSLFRADVRRLEEHFDDAPPSARLSRSSRELPHAG
jgi:uncharacterized protein (DUF58 family)